MEKITVGQKELAVILQLSEATVARLMSQSPERLPPCVRLGESRGRRVWLLDSVKEWLIERQERSAASASPTPSRAVAPVAPTKKLGRPRNGKTTPVLQQGGAA
jgi:predicted DNA-binding transcriptional regulator AlpA